MNYLQDTTHSEERYRAFIEHSTEGIWRFELKKPVSTRLPVSAQIRHFYTYAYLAECNDTMARMYGFEHAGQITGAMLGDLLPKSDKRNREYLTAFIRSGYTLTNAESFEMDKRGNTRIFQNNLVGIIEAGCITRAWGTQRDITRQVQLRERLEFLETVSSKLVVSLDHKIILRDIAKLIVPFLADYCRIVICDEHGEIKEIAVHHADPKKISLAMDVYYAYKDTKSIPYGIYSLLRNRRSEIIPEVTEGVLKKYNLSNEFIRIIRKINLKSYMGVPLLARGNILGAITFSSVTDTRLYTNDDLKFAEELARRIALTLDNNRLYSEVQDELKERKLYEHNLAFLAEASKVLSASLDYKSAFANVADLAVPLQADWCAIDMLSGDTIEQLVIAHKNPKKIKWGKEIRRKYPPYRDDPTGIANVLRTGKSELYPIITEDMLSREIQDKEYLSLVRKIGFTSVMMVPILVQGKAVGVISFISAELKRIYTESDLMLAEEVASRAALALENSRLYAESQKAVSLRDEFISLASHELKTPVTTMKMYTQVIQKQLNANGQTSFSKPLSHVDNQINKLSILISDLLNMSRLQAGKLEFRMEAFDLRSCVVDVVRDIQLAHEDHKLILKGSVRKRVFGDKDRIGQVIINVLLNAIKYSPDGGKIIISLIPRKNVVQVAIRDFGIGIDVEYHEKIFERFYRVPNPREMTYPGMGIGLYISDGIIKQHGGRMSVISKKGKGSLFRFTIPYALSS